jgi:hypothetical protein
MDVMSAAAAAPGDHTEMKHFTIDAENKIAVHDSRKAARETGLGVFSTEEQFADLIGNDNQRLVEIWNSLAGVKPVTKFASRKVATERIWKAIAALGGPTVADAQSEAAGGEDQPSEATSDSGEQVASAGAQAPDVAPSKAKAPKKATPAKNAPKGKKAAKGKEAAGPREGSKTAQVVAMLQRKNGATLAEIMAKMGWLKHTVRGFMAGAMKKAGFTVESFKPEGGERTYRISK